MTCRHLPSMTHELMYRRSNHNVRVLLLVNNYYMIKYKIKKTRERKRKKNKVKMEENEYLTNRTLT